MCSCLHFNVPFVILCSEGISNATFLEINKGPDLDKKQKVPSLNESKEIINENIH